MRCHQNIGKWRRQQRKKRPATEEVVAEEAAAEEAEAEEAELEAEEVVIEAESDEEEDERHAFPGAAAGGPRCVCVTGGAV